MPTTDPAKRKDIQRRYVERHRKECLARTKAWRQRNRARVRACERERYKLNRDKECAESRQWYWENRERALQRQAIWRRENPGTIREAGRRWTLANHDRRTAYDVAWRAANRDKGREHKRKRRARKHDAAGQHSTAQWLARVEFHGWLCFYCGVGLMPETLTQDHAIPLSRGGSDWPANLLPACMGCNQSKHTKTVFEYLTQRSIGGSP